MEDKTKHQKYNNNNNDDDDDGENSQIPRFGKIYSKLTMFWKYLAIYHFFSTRVSQNRVLNSTQVS